MKKILLLLLICAVITSNAACSKPNSSQNNDISSNQTENVDQSQAADAKDTTDEKPETESQTEQKEKPEVKPEVKPETKPVAKPTVPQTKPSTKPEQKPETKPEPKPDDNILNGDLKSIIEKIYAGSGLKLPKTEYKEVTSDSAQYFLGADDIEFSEAIASEPLMNAIPHSLVLLRVNNDSDIDKIKAEIKNKVDPRKWICVGVEEDDVIVDNIDNLIILIMDRESEKLHEAFLSLNK